ncbi:hypothetical protein [Klebsiella pasteurii]|uniref:hypothetical protein n=1 Tax=Klebsiella pasteurii TaxID=2587529 RepID=UPI001159A6BE|nr:hypothetical protein [Klebsiella pasteurii]VUS54293.1 hypothetical protein SB6417_02389 [Klebsiella pasteurii]
MSLPLNYNKEQWLSTLKPYQSSSINTLLEKNNEDSVVDIWLSSNRVVSRSPFGGSRLDDLEVKVFISNFKKEFKDFICGGQKYESDRERISSFKGDAKTYIVSIISSALATVLGSSAALLTPVIVVMLIVVSNMGRNAWCALEHNG